MASHSGNIDSATIAAITREVVRRLQSGSSHCDPPRSVELHPSENAPRLVTTETLRGYRDGSDLVLAHGAVVTPAARELAAERKIQLNPVSSRPGEEACPSDSSKKVDDALSIQLARRGIRFPSETEVVWTDTPAREVFERCRAGQVAAMVTAFADVDRFAAELSPTVWVLDRRKLNLVAAVNASARIARLAKPTEASR